MNTTSIEEDSNGIARPIVEVDIGYPVSRPVFIAMTIMIALTIAGATAITMSLGGTSVAWTIAVASCLLFGFVLKIAMRKSMKRKVHRLSTAMASDDIVDQIGSVLRKTKYIQVMAGLHEWVRQLPAAGHRGLTIRVCQPQHRSPLDPIQTRFEPQPLDETDPTLRHLSSAPAGRDADEGVPADPTWHFILRNVQLKGGWLIVGIFAFNLMLESIKAYRTRSITGSFVLFACLFLSVLFVPVGRSVKRSAFAVPGGLLFRSARKKGRGWDVHLFSRENAVLLAYQAGKRQWMLVAADESRHETVSGTRREIDFALQAWLSPVPPPDVERLSDFT